MAKRKKYEALWCQTEKRWLQHSDTWRPSLNPSGCGEDKWRKITHDKYLDLRAHDHRTRVDGVEDRR